MKRSMGGGGVIDRNESSKDVIKASSSKVNELLCLNRQTYEFLKAV